jgi:hypothetical protein
MIERPSSLDSKDKVDMIIWSYEFCLVCVGSTYAREAFEPIDCLY